LGDAAESIIGYFSLRTNRMTMYDLTGAAGTSRRNSRSRSAAQINQLLARPEAARTTATVVHEATHQIAFNCGLHARYSDCPLWFSEGIAIYFETPDLRSARGWRNIGAVNRPRLVRFRQYLRHRPADSLRTLLAGDDRFRDPRQSLDAYAEAWALTYFLIRGVPPGVRRSGQARRGVPAVSSAGTVNGSLLQWLAMLFPVGYDETVRFTPPT
jgi:hypothetical protein